MNCASRSLIGTSDPNSGFSTGLRSAVGASSQATTLTAKSAIAAATSALRLRPLRRRTSTKAITPAKAPSSAPLAPEATSDPSSSRKSAAATPFPTADSASTNAQTTSGSEIAKRSAIAFGFDPRPL